MATPTTYETRDAAKAVCKPDEVVCATILTGGKPVYFIMPRAVTEDEVRDRAFELRNGRPISAVERTLDSFAKRRQLWR